MRPTSWQAALAKRGMRAAGVKRSFRSPEATRAAIAEAQARRQRPGRPWTARRDLLERDDTVEGIVVHTVGPRPPTSRRLVYLHGGAYVYEISRAHWAYVRQLARRLPAEVDVPIYPLAPSSTAGRTVPAMTTVVRGILDRSDGVPVTLIGDSAGAGLALAVGQQLRDDHDHRLTNIVLLSPWLDVSMRDPRQPALEEADATLAIAGCIEAGRQYAGELATDDPKVSPLFGYVGGLPPLHVFTGTEDLLNPDAHRLAEACRAASQPCALHEAVGMPHAWMLLPFVPEARQARRAIASILREAAPPHTS